MTLNNAKMKSLIGAGKWPAALAMAARWAKLGDPATKAAILRGNEGYKRPDFMRQCGKCPDAAIAAGRAALIARYGA